MCSTMVTVAPGEEGKPLTAKAFAEFTAKCRKDRNKVTLKPVTTKQPSVTTTISSLTTSVPPLTTEIPSTTAEPPSTATLMQPPTTNFRQTTLTTKVSTTPLATPCFSIQTKSNGVKRIPESRDFTSYPVVLLFTLQNPASNLIELRFMDAGGDEIYTMRKFPCLFS
ncbi:uncharacterized protein P19A11.02c-like [Asterias rubens]|uniref:uncharacterized protein P19A11.02c-like n=1 Tax=Asterias rubens TaxID=7604 RepID=UPI0014553329|nr:uncharacterized protein P19A11.02c-like [Asterias rubens]